MTIECYAAYGAKEKLRPFSYPEPRRLGPMEVLIKISHCGICHSDIHLIDNDWQVSQYPLVPGHEIIGTVERTGARVRGLKSGERVGVGWQAGSCGHCEWCKRAEENLCPNDVATALGHYGGFAQKVVVDSRFAFPVPKALRPENAAPLLCGGVTVYSPLRRLVKRGQKIGVVGIGGLGHLALQFARAMGYDVTAFSHSPDKEKEARRFGAHRFVGSTREDDLAKLTRFFDFILITSYVKLDWPAYLAMLRPNGRIIVVGAVNEPLEIPSGAIISGQKGVVASVIGSRRMIKDMLDFAARHHIGAQTEVFPLAQVNAALDKVRRNEARYRVVLEIH
ncbi:MAG TPA: alcohol dehydrogenase [Candidatus Omnitrophica bacterium]|nr:alcohol dehydrogenase [Candidatus Omnitrophota bacterium]HCI44628.1 alcohol dehydrogenase [Candidatus Omnitrophota bacterium]